MDFTVSRQAPSSTTTTGLLFFPICSFPFVGMDIRCLLVEQMRMGRIQMRMGKKQMGMGNSEFHFSKSRPVSFHKTMTLTERRTTGFGNKQSHNNTVVNGKNYQIEMQLTTFAIGMLTGFSMEHTTHLEQGIQSGTPRHSEKPTGETFESATLNSPEREL